MGIRLAVIAIPVLVAEAFALNNMLASLDDVQDRFATGMVSWIGILEALVLIPITAKGFVTASQRGLHRGRVAIAALVVLAVPVAVGFDLIYRSAENCGINGTRCDFDPAYLGLVLLIALVPAIVLGIPVWIEGRRVRRLAGRGNTA